MKGIKWLSMIVCVLFISNAFSIAINSGEKKEGTLERNVIATITYKNTNPTIPTLQPLVVITSPPDGSVVTDPHLVVLGYATDETGMNYWEWTWEWEGGSYSNSSYFETAQYVEFKIDIYGLHPGWNTVTVTFKNLYGLYGSDSVTVTYVPPDNQPPEVTIEEPAQGQVFTEPNIHVRGTATDNVGITQFGYTHEWEGGATGSSWPVYPPTTYYPFDIGITLHEGKNVIKAEVTDGAGNYGYDVVEVTYITDTEPPVVVIEYPEDGATFTEPNITVIGHATDNVGIVSIGSHHEWEGGEAWTSSTVDPPVTYLPFDWNFTLHEGWNRITITGVDPTRNEGEDSVTVTYVVEDTIPPTTTLVVGEPKYFKEEDEMWYVTSETPFTLVAEDNKGGSGVNYTMYRICYLGNWSNWTEYGEPFYLINDGPHYIEFYSIDYEENMEEIHNITYYVDTAPPILYTIKRGDKHISDFAFICVSFNDAKFIIQGLYAYFVLRLIGYPRDHIKLMIVDEKIGQNEFNNIIERLNKSDKFSTKGKIEKEHSNDLFTKGYIINSTVKKELEKMLEKEDKDKEKLNWVAVFWYAINDFKKDIIRICKGKEIKEINVTFYLIGHGTKGGLYEFIDTGENGYLGVRSTEFWWVGGMAGEGKDTLYSAFEKPLKEKGITCKKVICLFDFCYSGKFLEALEAVKHKEDVYNNKVAVSSSNSTLWSHYSDESGSRFFRPFWKKIHAGGTVSEAYEEGKKPKHEYEGKLKTVGEIQEPQIKPPNANYRIFKKDPINSKTQISFEAIDEIRSPVMENEYFNKPVGVDYIKYRINGQEWIKYEELFTISSEGKYKLECYSADFLGNTGNIIDYTVIVDNTPPSVPNLLSPKNGELTYNTPSFDWSDVEDISDVYYALQIAIDETFKNIIFEKKDIIGSSYIMTEEEALSMRTYYWRVKAVDGVNNSGEWSEIWSFTITKENNAPEKPDKPIGPTMGKINASSTYSSSTTDIDEDKICYIFDWGDGTFTWTDWYDSGEIVNASHIWYEKGNYGIKVKTIDEHGMESEWSDPLPIVVPYSIDISIEKPKQGYLYIFGKKIIPLRHTIIIGPIKIGVNSSEANKVEFYIDGKLKNVAYEPPYYWLWDETAIGRHEIKVIAYDFAGNTAIDEQKVWIFNL